MQKNEIGFNVGLMAIQVPQLDDFSAPNGYPSARFSLPLHIQTTTNSQQKS